MFDTTKIKHKSNDYLSLIARVCLSAIFIWSGVNKIMNPVATMENMSAHGMPLTSFFLAGAIALEILGGLLVLLGIKVRWGAGMLIIFLIPATIIFHHDFSKELEQAMFLKNVAMLGGLLMLIQYGGGDLVLLRANYTLTNQTELQSSNNR